MTNSANKARPPAVWRLFSSVKLTIVLLIVLAVASVVGTLIPQRGQGALEFARELSPGVFRLLNMCSLFDLYHSLWFRLLLACLALNLIVCSLDRLPGAWRRFRMRPRADRQRLFEELPEERSFVVRRGLKDAAVAAEAFFRSRYGRIRQKETGEGRFFYGEKGRYSHFGVYLVHASVLMILVGGLVGSFFGFEAHVTIVEGETADTATLRKGGRPLKLGFEVRCDRFFVEFYESGAPREYRSELTFFENGKEVLKKSVRVNHPVQFKGVTFYQSNYGKVPGRKMDIEISRNASPRQEPIALEVEQRRPYPLPGSEARFQVVRARADFMGMGPAVLISVQPPRGEETYFWVFRHPEKMRERLPAPMAQSQKFNAASFSPYTFFLRGFESRFYTGLQANRDPGVPLVWAGCFMMVAGFFVTFFMSHRRIWIRLTREQEGVRISIAGRANKNPVGLQRELEGLTSALKESCG